MPTANYDASRLTQNRRNVALYAWYTQNNAAVAAGASIRREQPNTQLATVVTERRETTANVLNTSSCPCSEQVFNNPGAQ